MCYHTSLITDTAALEERLGRQMHGEARGQLPIPRTRAFARPWWPVISAEAPRVISWKQWGLIPEWAEHPDAFLERTPTFHTASETAYEEPAFQSAASAGRRCLIPVTSFVEWQHREAEGDAEPEKVPYEIRMRHEAIFCLGGIYEGDTYSILTRPAQAVLATINNKDKRQPVIIPKAFKGDWLNPALSAADVHRFCENREVVDLVAVELVKDVV